MRMPGFNADASLYETSKSYVVRRGGGTPATGARVVAQLRPRCELRCLGAWAGRTLGCDSSFCQFMADEMYDACLDNCKFY